MQDEKITPQEKAWQLRNWYAKEFGRYDIAPDAAMRVVEEIFEFMRKDDESNGTSHWANSPIATYWLKVKAELKNLKGH